MIKRALFILLFGLIIAGFGLIVMRESGFAVFSYGDTTIELPLIKFYFGVIVIFIVLYILFRLLGYIFRLPSRIHSNRQHKRQLEILIGLESSIIDASQFNWEGAVRNSTTHVKNSPIKRAQHLLAAQFAHKTDNNQLRDTHISKLRKLENGVHLANSAEADFAIDDNNADKALALLRDETDENIVNLNTRAKAYMKVKDVANLEKVLAKLQIHNDKAKRLRDTVITSLEWLIHYHDENAHADHLTALWKTYAKHIQNNTSLLRQYVHALCKNREDTLAEQIITTHLKHNWDEQLIQEYGLLTLDNTGQRIKQAESWLQKHKESAGLLLTLGRLHKAEKLWGKAKSYLESSLSRKPLAATYAELADLHEFLNETTDAQRCTKKGLHIATRDQSLKTKRKF